MISDEKKLVTTYHDIGGSLLRRSCTVFPVLNRIFIESSQAHKNIQDEEVSMIVKQAQNQLGCLNCATRLFLVLWRARKNPTDVTVSI
jgi:hypothetical protein